MSHALPTAYTSYDLIARFRGLVTAFRNARARRAAFHAAYDDLQMLSDRELVEYGLHRSDLVDLARAEAVKPLSPSRT